MKRAAKAKHYWAGEPGPRDDFGQPIEQTFVDGRTVQGHWALMSLATWITCGCGRLGPGAGQMYRKTPEGWLKVDG
jgi:hypothetical protein